MKKSVHLTINHWITVCGYHLYGFSDISVTEDPKVVTCKLCMKTVPYQERMNRTE